MGTENKTNTATSTYDEVTKRYQDALGKLNAATQDYEKTASDIYNSPMEPGHSFEDFMNSVELPEQKTQVDPKKEKSRAMIANIADAISAMGGIIGAARGADVVASPSLTAANQQRYDKLIAQRDAERDAYNKALMQQQSWAMNMEDAYRKRKQQEDARKLSAAETKLKTARTEYDLAGDALSRARTQSRDEASDARSDRAEQREILRYNDNQARQAVQDHNTAVTRVASLNNDEDKKWISFAGRDVDATKYASYIESVYNMLAAELKDVERSAIRDVENAKEKEKLGLMAGLVKKYLNDAKYKDRIINEGEKQKVFGKRVKWGLDENSGKIIKLPDETPTPAPTPAPAQPTQPGEDKKDSVTI